MNYKHLLETQNPVSCSDTVLLYGPWQQLNLFTERENVTELRVICAVAGEWRKPSTVSHSSLP